MKWFQLLNEIPLTGTFYQGETNAAKPIICPPIFMFYGSKNSVHAMLLRANNVLFRPKIQLETLGAVPSTLDLSAPLFSPPPNEHVKLLLHKASNLFFKHRNCQRDLLLEHTLLTKSFLDLNLIWSMPGEDICNINTKGLERP